mmetsp:Transcript_31163/g.74636  ORF Transcript_31163/g.74636 Transcript_31163/m.74636 type:complete len:329 (+) Transcript_31163:57-1043(+)
MRVSLASFGAVAASAGDSLPILVMGDWGGDEHKPYTTKGEISTAEGLEKVAASTGAKIGLALGDNFYHTGVTCVTDKRFDETFENVFTGEHLSADSGFRFKVLAGNHDHYGNVSAQVAYSEVNKRWVFPDLYHTFTETAPDGATVQFVMIDTVVLSGNSQTTDDGENQLPGDQLPGPENVELAHSQMKWIEETLKSSSADYIVVAGHYPVESICEHGPTSQLQKDVVPLLKKYGVAAYLSGHDHCQEHIDVGDGVQYHVIGSAHECDSSTSHKHTISKHALKFYACSNGGFGKLIVRKSGLSIVHFDAHGNELYTAPHIAPRSLEIAV